MRKLTLFLSLISSVGFASVQSGVPSDSIRRAPSSNVKGFGGFPLDIGSMNAAPLKLPRSSLDAPDVSRDYNQIFRLNTDASYTQGFTGASSSPFSGFGYGYGWGLSFSSRFVQVDILKLKNGWKVNTYGGYDKDGWGVPNRSAMPWERNNLRGAFEPKSSNDSFGIRIEVQQGRNGLY